MRVRVSMKVQISGVRDGVRWPGVGGEIVVPDTEGAELCTQGLATPVAEVAKPEKRPAKRSAEKRG